jgi:hypothetical protein
MPENTVQFQGKEIPVRIEEGIKTPPKRPRVTTSTGSPRRSAGPDPEPQPLNREQSVLGIFQMLAAGMSLVSPVDAATLVVHSPPIASAVAETAANDPKFAALLDKILHVGPYGALLGAIMPMALQLAVNHGLMQPGVMGTMPPEKIMELITGEDESPLDETSMNGSHSAPVG